MRWHDVEQNSPDWDALRLGKVTASGYSKFMANYGKAFGEPAKDYALRIALEIVTGRKAEYSFKNDDMERGHAQEPVARMLYEESRFVDVTNGGFFCWGTYGDSPDGLVGGDGVVEIKSVVATTHAATIRRGAPDPAYKWQLVGHLDCTGRQWVDFVSYCADYPEWDQLAVYRVNRGDVAEELAQLAERRAEFLALVQKNVSEINQRYAA
jgi:hypothetical protein